MHDLEKEAKRIIKLLKNDFVLPNGALSIEKKASQLRPYHLFSDLGDYLPFFLYFDETDFADKQIAVLKMELTADHILQSQFSTFGLLGLAKSYEYTDLLLGITDYYLFKRDRISKNLLLSVADRAVKIFNLDVNFKSFYKISWHTRLPVVDTRDGTLIECFVDIYKATGDHNSLKTARNIFRRLFMNNFYSRHHLLPTFAVSLLVAGVLSLKGDRRFEQAAIFKNNTNTIFALQALYREWSVDEVKERIFEMIEAIKTLASRDGGVLEVYDSANLKSGRVSLTASFGVLDLLCDNFKLFDRDEDLNFAREIADFWLSRSGKTGLLPHYADSKESFIDSETDIAIALYKLHELTGEEKYHDAAEMVFNGLITYHGVANYPLSVDINTGKVINGAQRTKFLALFLKLLILKIERTKGKKIYQDEELFSILRDR